MASTDFTLLDGDEAHALRAERVGGSVRLDPAAVRDALGWELKPEGLCRQGVCVPVSEPATLADERGVDLSALAACLDRPLALDLDVGAAALGTPARERSASLHSLEAPDFTLPDLDGRPHSLSEHRGRKVLLIAYASW